MGEVKAYLYADGNDPIEREKNGDVGEGARILEISNLKTSAWGFGAEFYHSLHNTLSCFTHSCSLHLILHPPDWIDTDL